MLPLIAVVMMFSNPTNVLRDFVAKRQPDFRCEVESTKLEGDSFTSEISMVSQKWQGHLWKHQIVLMRPADTTRPIRDCILVVTGDRVDRVDMPFAKKLFEASHLPVATLFDVPNQPLYDKREDDLIAYTFERYLESGESDWPLLLPMTNSVIKAMDAITKATGGTIDRFFITGESKRGWTTWLAAATGDPRILAIAPVAYDNLDIPAQLDHQMKTWGHLSEMLASYSDPERSELGARASSSHPSGTGLTAVAMSEGGQRLIKIIDPYAYLDSIHVPVFVVRGSNDPYWTADSTSLYWDKIKAPKELLVLPNEGHDFQSNDLYIRSLASFFVSGEKAAGIDGETFKDRAFQMVWSGTIKEFCFWRATSVSRDFRNSHWSGEPQSWNHSLDRFQNKGSGETLEKPAQGFVAFFGEIIRADGSAATTMIHIMGADRSQP